MKKHKIKSLSIFKRDFGLNANNIRATPSGTIHLNGHSYTSIDDGTIPGMSALFAPLYAASQVFGEQEKPFSFGCDPNVYFELYLSWNKTLDDKQFIRSDTVQERFESHAFKMLLEKFAHKSNPVADAVKLDRVEIEFYFKDIYQKIYASKLNNEIQNDMSLICELKEGIKSRLATSQNRTTTDVLLEKILIDGIDIINKSFPDYMNKETVEMLEKNPTVYFVDNNPCMNKENISVKTASEILDEFCVKANGLYPKVFVLDVTSSSKEQVDAFLENFNMQDKIPILVTASSMVKHSELGLDLWQGGENKTYLSKKAAINLKLKEEFTQFSEKLKEVTKGTESGLGRFARRFIRRALDEVYKINEQSIFSTYKGKLFEPEKQRQEKTEDNVKTEIKDNPSPS
jgi:hypothetical protein